MKELTYEEFRDRIMAEQRSRKIFVETGLTKNITVAFQAYQKLLAERDREVFLTNQMRKGSGHTQYMYEKYQMPDCPLCKMTLTLWPITIPEGPANRNGYKSHYLCENPHCSYEKYSTEEMIEELQKHKPKMMATGRI